MARTSPYPAELRERAVRMVADARPNYPAEWPAMKAVATKPGTGAAETVGTLSLWLLHATAVPCEAG